MSYELGSTNHQDFQGPIQGHTISSEKLMKLIRMKTSFRHFVDS